MPWSTRENREIPGAGEASMTAQRLEAPENRGWAIGNEVHAIDPIRAGQVQGLLGNAGVPALQQALRVFRRPGSSVIADNGAISPFSILLYADLTSWVAEPMLRARGSILWRERLGRHRGITRRSLWTAGQGLTMFLSPYCLTRFRGCLLCVVCLSEPLLRPHCWQQPVQRRRQRSIPTSAFEITPLIGYVWGRLPDRWHLQRSEWPPGAGERARLGR